MTSTHACLFDSAYAIRDRYLGPAILSPFADDLAHRLARLSIGPVLELKADVGLLTQAIAAAMSVGLTIIATDPDGDLLDYAAEKPGTGRVIWRVAEPAGLPFNDETFGIITCQFGFTAMADRKQAFREARRVLKPGGRFVFNIPGTLRANPVADCVHDALGAILASEQPSELQAALHGTVDNAVIDEDLVDAGFTDASYVTVDLPCFAASARDVALGYCLGTPVRHVIEARAPGQGDDVVADYGDDIVDAVTQALTHCFGSGPIETTMRAHVVSAAG